jgi:hypoxanthine phosphoribosyltransferase
LQNNTLPQYLKICTTSKKTNSFEWQNEFYQSIKNQIMNTIQIKDKKFELSIPEAEIQTAVLKVAERINRDIADTNPLFICVLNGSFMFASDLMKIINFPCEITFVKLSSYAGIYSSGTVKEVIGLSESIVGRNVVVLEDIVDTGITMERILDSLNAKGANSIKIATFLQKPDALLRDITVDYVAMTIPNDFIVGYGLDYDGYGRNLKDIYTVVE